MDPSDIMQVYEQLRERFSWKNHVSDNGVKTLSPIQEQLAEWCLYYAIATTLASNFRVQQGKDISFSVPHLKELSDEAKKQFPGMTAAKRLLKKLIECGVLTENDYLSPTPSGFRYFVSNLKSYDMDNLGHIKDALYKLRQGGPLCAVIRISKNYDDCYKSGAVYKYDPYNLHGSTKPITHALSVISFALENGPFFECQDSHGDTSGNGGFLKVDVTSIKELYSFEVHEFQVNGDWATC